jgi:hypothetical protein
LADADPVPRIVIRERREDVKMHGIDGAGLERDVPFQKRIHKRFKSQLSLLAVQFNGRSLHERFCVLKQRLVIFLGKIL